MPPTALEFILTLIAVAVWIGPLVVSLRHRRLNLLHPQFAIPIWIAYLTANAMVEKWYPWMIEPDPGIIRTTEANLRIYADYYLLPLLILAAAGLFFHFGVRTITHSISSNTVEISRQKILSSTFISDDERELFLLAILGFSAIAWMPNYFIPNAGLGTFWTYPVAMANVLVPFCLWFISKPWMTVALISTSFTILFMSSKASLIYPLLPIAFYYFHVRFQFKSNTSIFIPVFFVALMFTLLSLGGFDFVLAKILHRDYAFEVFAALIHMAPNTIFGSAEFAVSGLANGPVISWTLAEIVEGIPSALNPFKQETINPAKLVTAAFLPEDYAVLPFAYFNRFLLFAGYYDFGLIGALLQAFLFGVFYAVLWRKTLLTVEKEGHFWPLIVYAPIPAISSYFVSVGGISYGLIISGMPSLIFLSCVLFAKIVLFFAKILKQNLHLIRQ